MCKIVCGEETIINTDYSLINFLLSGNAVGKRIFLRLVHSKQKRF